ncbi:ABC transporter substrate-binding protein [Lysinibacillus endophyticus]|uniref:ABC transporter substrate-binding protein n=1 Tax=Ureibacillus endophyticus TaxID=1978490 RepID=UPI00209D32A5|nr:sugar ABC transporter substrate-binding protein [Lysinibacillus endophyticus]MCP1146777.1 sugar ABC transporter substrate-binding protein [Lysinibacillus endophyticus]
MSKLLKNLLLLVAVFALILAGCSDEKEGETSNDNAIDTSEPVKVLLSAGDIGQFNAWKARSEQFTKDTGIKVEFLETPYDNLLENITTDGIANGGAYDLVVFLDSMGPALTQFLEPLNSYIERDNFDVSRWPQSLVNLSTFEDNIYSFPVRGHVQMMFYRDDIFKKHNLKVPTTWDEFDVVAKTIKEKEGIDAIAPYYKTGNNGQNLFMWTSYLWGNNGDIFDGNYKPIFNNKEGVEATQRYVDLLLKDKVAAASSVSYGEQESRTHFKQGDAAIWIGWWWVFSEFNSAEASAPEVVGNVKYAAVPTWDGKGTSTNISSFPLAITKGSKNKDAAWEVLKWIASTEEELDIVTQTWENTIDPSQASTVVTQTANLKDEKLNELSDNFYAVAAEGFENSRALPNIPEWSQVADILSSAISNIVTGASVQSELDKAATQVETILKSAGYYD